MSSINSNDDSNQNEQQNRICLYSDLQLSLNNLKNEFSNRFSMLEKEICSINIHLNSQIQNSVHDVDERIKKLETNEKNSFDEKSEKICNIEEEIRNLKNNQNTIIEKISSLEKFQENVNNTFASIAKALKDSFE